ncbi:M48 metallopeptidase family protein [Arthrobacter sedimenti]|uniref:M48 metallopeptidase family protein n=1 Tax=Arthrobacter sedimenti TaxID=2694931 RepID=UPI000B5709E3|nr:M48 family metallopeptidase [Arthrobacter sedimenti]OUM39857.1 metal-dependent hydrolase [Arthrobacter agilis]
MTTPEAAGPPGPGRLPVEVRRSARRKRTVSADIRDGVLRVSIPGHFSASQERHWVERMVERMSAKYFAAPAIDDDRAVPALLQRAGRLAEQYLGGRGVPATIGWVTNQNSRWASATPAHRSIRLSHKLQGMPDWVVDYVILHEMAHLIEPSHNAAFWDLLITYPRTETAKAFLDGAAFAAQRSLTGGQEDF